MASLGLQTSIWNNNLKSILLLVSYPFLLLFLIWLFFAGLTMAGGDPRHGGYVVDPMQAGIQGVMQYGHVAFLAAGAWFVISFFFHQSMINASTGARPVERREEPRIYNLLENLCISRGIAMPKLYIIDSDVLNAYASGLSEKSYAITLTRGITRALDDQELEGVIGHELTHIMNRDVKLLVISVVFVGMISFLCDMAFRMLVNGSHSRRGGKGNGAALLIGFLVLAVGYLFSILIRFALSRRREYMADAGAVELTKNPAALASALRKISGNSELEGVTADVKQMMIENSTSLMGMFATHPPIEARIAILDEWAGGERHRSAPAAASAPTGPWG